MKLVSIIFILSLSNCLFAQTTKKKLEEQINAWYKLHPTKYEIKLDPKIAVAKITRYYPERLDEQDDIIQIEYKGMGIELKFDKPLEEITLHKDSLQKHFSYLVLDRICHSINTPGWKAYPITPLSSNSNDNCVKFISVNGSKLNIELNWETFTFSGTSNSKNCLEELSIEDGSLSEGCYLRVDKILPLKITGEVAIVKSN